MESSGLVVASYSTKHLQYGAVVHGTHMMIHSVNRRMIGGALTVEVSLPAKYGVNLTVLHVPHLVKVLPGRCLPTQPR
jgi:hypothetical protein